MQEATLPLLITWQSFYVIIGSSAGTLTGLMFVVITLVTGTRSLSRSGDPIGTFNTPNVVHFCAALLVAAILCAPWQVLWNASLLLGICGLGGAIYIVIVLRRMRHLIDYTPVLEDWLCHVVFPFVSYVALVIAAIMLPSNPASALLIIGAVTVLFLFIGIHNAWDIVTFLVNAQSQPENKS